MRVLAVVCVLAFAASPALAAKVSLPGQVTYRERVALPGDATLRLQLVDESLPSAPPRLDVEAAIGAGQVPLSFSLSFEDTIIIPDHSYALIAAISSGGGLMFRNFEPYPVNPLAPAAPVLIVTNMVATPNTDASSSAPPPAPQPVTPAPIFGTTWTATDIGGAAIVPRTSPSMTIGDDLHAGGSGGCNSWSAQAVLDGDTLRFGAVISTQRACTSNAVNLQEQAFFAALGAAASWKLEGNALTLYGADGAEAVRFSR